VKRAGNIPRFAFLVHALVPFHQRVIGVRAAHVALATGGTGGIEAVTRIGVVELPTSEGPVFGHIIGVPDLPGQLVEDQNRALALQIRAARIAEAEGVSVIGLGSALAVVAGRGTALAEQTPLPVTTGQAATAWACAEITVRAHESVGGPIGVLGYAGAVGEAVAHRLRARGLEVIVDAQGKAAQRRADDIGATRAPIEEVVARARLLVGTSTTGPLLDPQKVPANRVLVDLALPPTLASGPRPPGWTILGGETLRVPGRRRGGFWGTLWLAFAGYGRSAIYACVAEPAVMAITGHRGFSAGRHLNPEHVDAVGRELQRLGFQPELRPR
jgi:fatty aldehyde-generating acyl-ACP reductase